MLVKIKNYVHRWKYEFLRHKYSILFSLFLLILSVVINYNAGKYVDSVASNTVSDIFIDNFGPVNLTWVFVYVWLIVVVMIFIYPLFFDVSKIHNVIIQFGFLNILRSLFITLTHLKTPVSAIIVDFPGLLNAFAFQNDLFFSGHTAIPFLAFLVFKGHKIRYFFLASSILLALTVLLMHQHYTIDVLGAYFITYGAFKLGNVLLKSFNN